MSYAALNKGGGKNLNVDKIQFHLLDGSGRPTGVFDFRVFEYIKNNYPIFICGYPYLYSHGVFDPDYKGTKIKKNYTRLLI